MLRLLRITYGGSRSWRPSEARASPDNTNCFALTECEGAQACRQFVRCGDAERAPPFLLPGAFPHEGKNEAQRNVSREPRGPSTAGRLDRPRSGAATRLLAAVAGRSPASGHGRPRALSFRRSNSLPARSASAFPRPGFPAETYYTALPRLNSVRNSLPIPFGGAPRNVRSADPKLPIECDSVRSGASHGGLATSPPGYCG